MSELEQILLQRLEVAESKLMDLGWLRSSKGHYVAARESAAPGKDTSLSLNIERFVHCARDLTYGMHERTKRLPDYADFRAAFNALAGAPAEKTATPEEK